MLFEKEIGKIETVIIRDFSGKATFTNGEIKELNFYHIIDFIANANKKFKHAFHKECLKIENFLPIVICFVAGNHNINIFKNSIKSIEFDNYNYNYTITLKSGNQLIIEKYSLTFFKKTYINRKLEENFDICKTLYDDGL